MKKTIKLPSFLKPLYETDLIRLGGIADGGYIIPEKSVKMTEILYSFGLSTDWSFEEAIYKEIKPKIYCYDHTVSWKTFFKSFTEYPQIIFHYFKYKNFFNNKDRFHIKKRISPKGSYNYSHDENITEDINSIINLAKERSIMLKIDIEGDEYRILEQIKKNSHLFNCLIIEFHNVDLHLDKISNFINKFDLQLVHLHVNNWSMISPVDVPRALELTFSPQEFNKKITVEKKYPSTLDKPNNINHEDLEIKFI